MMLRDISMRGTQSQDKTVGVQRSRRALLKRYGYIAGAALALLILALWSARAWLLSDQVIARDRMRTAVVARGPFVRDVAATGLVVAAVSPTLFAEAPGTIINKVRAGDTVKTGDVLGVVDSAALTNEYDQERAEDAWGIHVVPQRDFERARDDLETAKLNYAHAIATGGLE